MKRASLLAVAVGVLAIAGWYFSRDKERLYSLDSRQTATRVLAEHLAAKFSGQRVLIISNPFTQAGAPSAILNMEEAGLAGLREGFGKKVTLKVVFPDLKPQARSDPRSLLTDPETSTPLSYLVADDSFDKLVNANAADLIVSLIGLPLALDKVQCWQAPKKPAFALLLPDLRLIGDVSAAIKSEKLVAFVLPRPGVSQVTVEPKKKDFEKRFLLVTPDNFDQLSQQHPKLFIHD